MAAWIQTKTKKDSIIFIVEMWRIKYSLPTAASTTFYKPPVLWNKF